MLLQRVLNIASDKYEEVEQEDEAWCHLRRFVRTTPPGPASVVLRFCAEVLVADRRWDVTSVMLLRRGSCEPWFSCGCGGRTL